MSAYINFQFQIKDKDGAWLNRLNQVYSQGCLRDIFNERSFSNYPVEGKGFPDDFKLDEDCNEEYSYGKTWYSKDELYNFLTIAKDKLKKKIKEIEENNKYTLFKGLMNKESFEDIKYELKELNEEDYEVCEMEELERLVGVMEFIEYSENSEVRLIVWFD